MQNFQIAQNNEPYASNAKPLTYYVDTDSAIDLSERYGSHLQNLLFNDEKQQAVIWLGILLMETEDKSLKEVANNPSYENITFPDQVLIKFIDSLNQYQKRQFLLFLATDLS